MQRRSFIVTAAIASALPPARAMAATAELRIGVAAEADALTSALRPWPGPYGGLPPFDRVATADIEPAMAQALRLCRAEIDAIAADPAPPDFANTLAALEEAGRPLDRIATFYGVRRSTLQSDAVAALVREMAPRLAAFDDETTQSEALFKRIDLVKQSAALPTLAPQQRRLVDVVHRRFRHRGAGLDPAAKARVKAINQRLASLGATFSQSLLAEEQNALVLDSEADLAGLSAELRGSAAEAAFAAGKPGRWSFANTRSAIEPFLVASSRRDLREKAWRMWAGRGDNNDANDNKAVITETLRLREERALLFGFPSHAHWVTEIKMAGTPDAALALMMQVWRPALARARAKRSPACSERRQHAAAGAGLSGLSRPRPRCRSAHARQRLHDRDERPVAAGGGRPQAKRPRLGRCTNAPVTACTRRSRAMFTLVPLPHRAERAHAPTMHCIPRERGGESGESPADERRGRAMTGRRFEPPGESRVMAWNSNFALLSMFVPDLSNTLLVQLFGSSASGRKVFSLYSVYREGPMTFDAIIRFDMAEPILPLGEVLRRFVEGSEFKTSVLLPMVRIVRRHFAVGGTLAT